MPRTHARSLVLLAAMVATVTACGGNEAAAEDAPGPPPRRVKVTRVERRDVPIDLEWVATLDGYVSADVRPRVSGYVTRRLYREGTRVEKGAPLFQIDDRTYRQAVDQARANLAQARVERTRSSIDYRRVAPIADTGAVSREEVTNAHAATKAAGANVAAARAALRDARLSLAWTTVRAPVAGVAGIRQAEVGDLVQPTNVLTRVASLDPIRASFAITEEQYLASASLLRALAFGGTVSARSEARAADAESISQGTLSLVLADDSVYPHAGRLEIVDLGIDPRTGTLSLVCIFENPDLLLRPGQFARIRLRSAEGERALVVPARAIMELQGITQLAVVDPRARTVEIRTVRLGPRVGELAVVRDGAREGELVVTEGVQGLTAGARVDPVEDGREDR